MKRCPVMPEEQSGAAVVSHPPAGIVSGCRGGELELWIQGRDVVATRSVRHVELFARQPFV